MTGRPRRAVGPTMQARAATLAALALAAAGCGDGLVTPPEREPTSGSRLVLMWLGYDDGARQLHRDEVFDLVEGAPCRPLRWPDGAVRCTPVADDAVYVDAACTRAVGRTRARLPPTHFIGRDRVAGVLTPTRLYRAGPVVDPVTTIYERRDDVCVGPFTAAGGLVHHAVGAQVDVTSLAPIDEHDDDGDGDGAGAGGRLAVHTWRSPDGLSLPAAVLDRALGVACEPTVEPDGRVRCHPRGATVTNKFADPACRQPVVVATAPPSSPLVEVTDDAGCSRYHRVGGERSGPVFVLNNGNCFAHAPEPGERFFDVVEPVALAELDRTVEQEPWRRLQRIVLSAGAIRVADDRMFDTATGADCRPVEVDGALRCMPEVIAAATTSLFGSSSCALPAPVALLPQPTCGPARFARDPAAVAGALQLVGDPRPTAPYQFVFGQCAPYTPPADQVVHDLGPVLAPTLFVHAVRFGDR